MDATLHDDLGLRSLFDAEAAWAPTRIRLMQYCLERGIRGQDWPQSLHWNWAKKALQHHRSLSSGLDIERLMGIECKGDWQGLLLGECTSHRSRTSSPPKELVYVEFVESAPWNWPTRADGQEPLYRGVGLQLLEMAIRWSEQLGFKGRLGLHSLSQSEDFYRDRCQMTDLGTDTAYQNLVYFELTETQATRFLSGHKK